MSDTVIGQLTRGAALIALLLFATSAGTASAQYKTWEFTGTLNGSTLVPDWILIDGNAPGPGNPIPPNVTAAGIIEDAPFWARYSWDPNATDLYEMDPNGLYDPNLEDPNVAVYVSGALEWTVGTLSARTAYVNQVMTVVGDINAADPNDPPLIVDLIVITGGNPPIWNGGPLQVVTGPADPNSTWPFLIAPTIALTTFNIYLTGDEPPRDIPFIIPDKGFSLGLYDSDTDKIAQLSGTFDDITVGTPFDCGPVGGDSDGDLICADVDKCNSAADIDQSDIDYSGIGNACNDATDADGDDWEDAFDPCISYRNEWPMSVDANGDYIPDECQCGDTDNDGFITPTDAFTLITCAGAGGPQCAAIDMTLWDTDNDGFATPTDAFSDLNRGNAGTQHLNTCARRPEGTVAPPTPEVPYVPGDPNSP